MKVSTCPLYSMTSPFVLDTGTTSRAWEILESKYGRTHPEVGEACISLANLAIVRHRPAEAMDWFRRALETFEVKQQKTATRQLERTNRTTDALP